VMILLNDHPTNKPPHLLLITCATLTTGSQTHVAKCSVCLCIAVISNFILVIKNMVSLSWMPDTVNQNDRASWKAFFVQSRDIKLICGTYWQILRGAPVPVAPVLPAPLYIWYQEFMNSWWYFKYKQRC